MCYNTRDTGHRLANLFGRRGDSTGITYDGSLHRLLYAKDRGLPLNVGLRVYVYLGAP